MHTIATRGICVPNDYGMPAIATFNRFIAIPQGAEAIVKVNCKNAETISGINLAPSEGSQCENEAERGFYKDPKVYAVDALYPSSEVTTGETLNLRGVDVIHLGVCPVQFNPVKKEVVVHRNIDIEIEFKGGNGHFGEDRLRSPYWDPILKNNILNYNNLEPIDYSKRMQEWTRNRAIGCEYLIITPNNTLFRNAAQELADYRMRQGILTKVYTIEQTGTFSGATLQLWIQAAYMNWDIPPAAVCLLGEHGNDVSLYVPAFIKPHPIEGTCFTDNPYADVNNDGLPDICFSRLVAENVTELPILVGKQMEYEYTNPNMDPFSYEHPITASGWDSNRWFQITIETVGGFLRNHNKFPSRINNVYNGTPENIWSGATGTNTIVSYFGPDGVGYIPSTPDQLGEWDTGNKYKVMQAINEGTYLIQHRDHGWTQKWYQPEIYVSDFGDINNPGKMPFLISVNCKTGEYTSNVTCFTEGLIRMTRNGQNAGIVGAISPTAQSYSFANDAYLWGIWDHFDPSFLPDYGPCADHIAEWMPAFANVAGKYFLAQNVFPNSNQDMRTTTYNIFHTHADAFLRVFTEVPRSMEVNHDPTITCFTPFHITAPEGTQIAITCKKNRSPHILAVIEASGEEQEITITENVLPTENIHLTITGLNYLRYEEDLEMEPLSGPCVVTDSINLNCDGPIHFGQPLQMDIELHNFGSQANQAGTATLYTNCDYLDIPFPTIPIPTIEPSQSTEIENAFTFSVSPATPDGTIIPLYIRTEHDNISYHNEFEIKVVSPGITARLVEIEDYSGDHNNLLDPGEFAHIKFEVTNSGHYIAEETNIEFISDGYLQIISPTITIDSLEIGESTEVTCDVYVEWIASEAQYTQFSLLATTEELENLTLFDFSVGLASESFENGIHPIIWDNDSDHPWFVTDSIAYEGNFCAQSANIIDDESSTLSLTYTSTTPGEIAFYSKTSSESNYDWLRFYIDDLEESSWSGETYWAVSRYNVAPGTHTFTWSYQKDYSVSSGYDCAWLDYITLPAHIDGADEQAKNELAIHPNPTTDMIFIPIDDSNGTIISVFDEQGRMVIQEKDTNTISFKNIRRGLYHIKVEKEGRYWTQSIIKM